MAFKMEKIKNYNQVLLAVAGTIGILFLLVSGGFVLLHELGSLLTSDRNQNSGILARSETDNLSKDSLRKQIISFDNIQLIDSASQTYILPVTQATLADIETTRDLDGLRNKIGSSYKSYPQNFYNNLVIYNSLSETSEIVFEERVGIKNFVVHKSESRFYVVIEACSTDSNGDDFLNNRDLHHLYVYDLGSDKLSKVSGVENYTTLRSIKLDKSTDFLVQLGRDRNGDGTFDSHHEPMVFYKIDFKDLRLKQFVSNQGIESLQKLLEGS